MLEQFYARFIGVSVSRFLQQVVYRCILLVIQWVCMWCSENELIFNRSMFLRVQFDSCNCSDQRAVGVTVHDIFQKDHPRTNAAVELISKCLGQIDHRQCLRDRREVGILVIFLVLKWFPLDLKILHSLGLCHVRKRDGVIECLIVSHQFSVWR